MSVRPFDISTLTSQQSLQTVHGQQVARSGDTGAAFTAVVSAAMERVGAHGSKNALAAQAVEMMHLDMMRSALTLDGSAGALSSPATKATAVAEMIASYAECGAATASGAAADTTTAKPDRETGPAPSVFASDPGLSAVIAKASRCHGVDEGLIRAVIQVESNFKTTAVSHAGAKGLMQLMPGTAASLGVTNPFDAEQNVMAGTRYLKGLLTRYGGNLDKALSAYNWGPGNLERGGSLPAETRNYLVKVKKLYEQGEKV